MVQPEPKKNIQSRKLHPDSNEISASEVKPVFGMWQAIRFLPQLHLHAKLCLWICGSDRVQAQGEAYHADPFKHNADQGMSEQSSCSL